MNWYVDKDPFETSTKILQEKKGIFTVSRRLNDFEYKVKLLVSKVKKAARLNNAEAHVR